MGKEWRFTQLGGARRTLTLAGAAAPHGRPRKGAVVSDGVKLRKKRVFYPDGGNAPPTTHVFGTEWIDWPLKGRFSDAHLGKGGTKTLIQEWQTFVVDAQPVEITWGDILSARGLVDSFEPERESEFECAYTIVVCIDRRDIEGGHSAIVIPKTPLALCRDLRDELELNVSVVPSLPNAGDLKPDFLDTLEEAVSNINGFSASLLRIAGDIDAFADATFDQLERLRAGAAQMRTAVNTLRGTIDSTQNDAALLARAADTDVQWFATRANTDISTMRILALLEELDREAEIARRGRALAVYLARLGDSWESISTQFFGGPDEAGTIRDANGVLYGALPVPGREYQIPLVV
jgi:hypothetical protein